MIDLITLGLFCIGFIFLIKGAHILVDGASVLAKRYGVSHIYDWAYCSSFWYIYTRINC